MTTKLTIGVDVSKDNLDIFCLPNGEEIRVSNDLKGFRDFAIWNAESLLEKADSIVEIVLNMLKGLSGDRL